MRGKKYFLMLSAFLLTTVFVWSSVFFSRIIRYCDLESAFQREFAAIFYDEETERWYNKSHVLERWNNIKSGNIEYRWGYPEDGAKKTALPLSFSGPRQMIYSEENSRLKLSFQLKNNHSETVQYGMALMQYLDGEWYIVYSNVDLDPFVAPGEKKELFFWIHDYDEDLEGYRREVQFYGRFRLVLFVSDDGRIDPSHYQYLYSDPFWLLPKHWEK